MARDLKGLLGRVLLFVDVTVAVVACCYWLAVYVAPTSMSAPTASGADGLFVIAVRDLRAADFVSLFAAALLLANFLWLVYGGGDRAPAPHVLSETPDGQVKVSREALESGLRAAGEALEEISRLRVGVHTAPGMRRVVVRAQFHAPDSVAIHSASERLRQALRARFEELVRLGESSRLETEVEFLGFAGKLPKQAASEAERAVAPEDGSDATDEEQPFTGPRYPIDEDDPRS